MFEHVDGMAIFVSLIFSAVGFVYFSYGKKQKQFWYMLSGLFLMVMGYFFDSVILEIACGIVAIALPILATRFGWFQ